MSENNAIGKKRGSVLIAGAGIGGMQAALDLADSGIKVHLVEKDASIGGTMVRLDKTFPTGDCAMCMISPKMVEVGRHPNVEVRRTAEVVDMSGVPGDFKIKIREKARSIDPEKCTGCGACTKACPVRNIIQVPIAPEPPPMESEWETCLNETLEEYKNDPSTLVSMLQEINERFNYLPQAVLSNMAHRLGIPESHVLAVATFYNAFSLIPVGRHIIEVCSGTACHVKGAARIIDRLKEHLQVETGLTTSDNRFTLRTVNCIGCCALAPALRVDGEAFGYVKVSQLPKILKGFE